jgi:hypothetical protein
VGHTSPQSNTVICSLGRRHPGLGGCYEHRKSEDHDDAALFPFALECVEAQFCRMAAPSTFATPNAHLGRHRGCRAPSLISFIAVAFGGRIMPRSRYSRWLQTVTCQNCKALYQVIKINAGPETADREIACQSCGALLPGREGQFVRKYFFFAARRTQATKAPYHLEQSPQPGRQTGTRQ